MLHISKADYIFPPVLERTPFFLQTINIEGRHPQLKISTNRELVRSLSPQSKISSQSKQGTASGPAPDLFKLVHSGTPPPPRPGGKRVVGLRLRGILILSVFADRRRTWTRSAKK